MIPRWRYKRFHVSVLLAWLGAGLLVGLFAGKFAAGVSLWWVLPLALVAIVAFHNKRWFSCLLITVVGVGLGMVRGGAYAHELNATASFVGKNFTVIGVVSQDPVLKNGSNLWQAQMTSLEVAGRQYAGEMYATIVSDGVLKRGDKLTLVGTLQAGFGTFSVTMYRAVLQHTERFSDVFRDSRDTFAEGVRRVVPEPEASLGVGFLVGQKSSLPDDLLEQMKTVGLTHIVVASGYNLTILVRFARRLLARKSRYLALACSLVLVGAFVLVSGFSPSMNRAAVVTVLTLVAWYYGRKFHPIKLIAYVAAVSAVIYPAYVWGDLGWLLSFAAFTGVLVLAPIITRLLYKPDKEPSAFMRLIVETLSAEFMTLPIILVAFGYVPVLALLANILVAPVIPFAMLCTFVAGVVGLTIPLLTAFAFPASIVIAYVVAVVGSLSSPAWARFDIVISPAIVVIWYVLMVCIMVFIGKKRHVDLLASSVVE